MTDDRIILPAFNPCSNAGSCPGLVIGTVIAKDGPTTLSLSVYLGGPTKAFLPANGKFRHYDRDGKEVGDFCIICHDIILEVDESAEFKQLYVWIQDTLPFEEAA